MSKFEFLVTKYVDGEVIWKELVTIRANEKLDAVAKIERIFSKPNYTCKFIQTC